MDHYSIELTIDGVKSTYSQGEQSRNEFFGFFIKTVCDAFSNRKQITSCSLLWKGILVLDQYEQVVKAAIGLGNLSMMAMTFDGAHNAFESFDVMVKAYESKIVSDEHIYFRVEYDGVLYDPLWFVSPQPSIIYKFVEEWAFIVNSVYAEVPKEKVDSSWMMGYYISTEVKQIKELIDTNPEEAKKRLSVMEYMVNSKVKI